MTEVKTLTNPSGQTFKLGRNKPLVVGPHLRILNYMLLTLPPPPSSMSYIAAARRFLSDILGNGNNGDCTVAAAFHIGGMLLQNAEELLPADFNASTAVKLYYQLTGGRDVGLDEQTVFNWWQAHGLCNDTHKIAARVSVDPTNKIQVQTALWLFENLYLTASVPNGWISPFPSGNNFTWGVVGDPNPEQGHAFCGCAYNADGVIIDSWGLFGTLTWDALAKYCNRSTGGGCYSVLSSDAINTGSQRSPSGFAWAQLQADMATFQV